MGWLKKCNKLRKLDFNPQRRVTNHLRYVGLFAPSSRDKLKKELPGLFSLLVKYNIIYKALLFCVNRSVPF